MEIDEALSRLYEYSDVAIQSTDHLAGQVRRKAKKLDEERRAKKQDVDETKPQIVPVPAAEHGSRMNVMPWELLHLLGRATVLSGHGSSRALAQHWSCLKYITTLQSNADGRMELSPDGRDPRFHRRSVQAEDLGIAFALAAALRIAGERHPGYRFEIADADVALEAGWALRGTQVKSKPHTRLRPDYFLIGLADNAAPRVITVECKGSHGPQEAQHRQLAKAAAQVHAVVIGDPEHGDTSPPGLMMSTALADRGGIQMRILDPPGDGVLVLPDDGHRGILLNEPIEEYHEFPGIPIRSDDAEHDARPGFYIAADRTDWFARVLSRTATAGLLAFVGDRRGAGNLLTPRQRTRLGSDQDRGVGYVTFDTEIELAGIRLVGTDHVFRLASQRMEAFAGIPYELYELLHEQPDLRAYHDALPSLQVLWHQRQDAIGNDWGGVIFMDTSGAAMGLRKLDLTSSRRSQLR
ncbi:hypothetical protein [Nocardia donostiensis]|nr:hypothetical protein [Nocardia donostiensis]